MESIYSLSHQERALQKRHVSKPNTIPGVILEAWGQGFMVGALIIMSCITLVNMRRGVLLHKIIFVELIFGIWHGFFIFYDPPVYGWYLSVSAIFLNTSWSLHNVIAWMKNKPFLSRRVSLIYIISVALVQPYWVIEIYANFTYFNNINTLFVHTRPFEALFRDPWWIFTTISLFYNIKSRYELTLPEILRLSPRFAIMLVSMILSICFLITDICSVTGVFNDVAALPLGLNPFWKLSFVFKCLTDSVILDDFKTALDRLRAFKISRLGSFAVDGSTNSRQWRKGLSPDHHPWDNHTNNNNNLNNQHDPDDIYNVLSTYHPTPTVTAGTDTRKKFGNDTTIFTTTRRVRKDSFNPLSNTRKRFFKHKHSRDTSPPSTSITNLTTFPRSTTTNHPTSPFQDLADQTAFPWPLKPNPPPSPPTLSPTTTNKDKPSSTHLENSPAAATRSPPTIIKSPRTNTTTNNNIFANDLSVPPIPTPPPPSTTRRKTPLPRDRDDTLENVSRTLGDPEPSWLESPNGRGRGGEVSRYDDNDDDDHDDDDDDDDDDDYDGGGRSGSDDGDGIIITRGGGGGGGQRRRKRNRDEEERG